MAEQQQGVSSSHLPEEEGLWGRQSGRTWGLESPADRETLGGAADRPRRAAQGARAQRQDPQPTPDSSLSQRHTDVVLRVGSGARLPRFKSQPLHLQPVWPWVSYFTSLCIPSLHCKLGDGNSCHL